MSARPIPGFTAEASAVDAAPLAAPTKATSEPRARTRTKKALEAALFAVHCVGALFVCVAGSEISAVSALSISHRGPVRRLLISM
jgi:hypothetical protein